MKEPDTLKEIERKAYRSVFEDGIYDIQFGLLFVVFAAISVLESLGVSRFLGYLLLIIPIVLPLPAKRYITVPRMGIVVFGPKRQTRKKLIAAIGVGVVLLMLPLIIMIVSRGIGGADGWFWVAIFAAPVLVLAVIALDSARLYIYAALLLAGAVESEFLLGYVDRPIPSLISFGLPGTIILIFGLTLFFRFIQKYPKPNPEASRVG
jgi:hypothetical protein